MIDESLRDPLVASLTERAEQLVKERNDLRTNVKGTRREIARLKQQIERLIAEDLLDMPRR